jgi:hypothetical protein
MLRRIALVTTLVSAALGGHALGDGDRPPGAAIPPMMFHEVEPPSAAPGQQVTIKGLQFMSGARVWLGDVEATDVTVETGQRIVVTVPEHAPTGKVSVMVRNPDGRTVSRGRSFTYHAS